MNTFGLSESQFKLLTDIVIAPLKKKGAQIFIFGSRARGNHHKFSDIDIFFEDTNAHISSVEVGRIKEAAEESKLAITVDLVNKKDLAKSYSKKIETEKIEV